MIPNSVVYMMKLIISKLIQYINDGNPEIEFFAYRFSVQDVEIGDFIL